MTFAIDSVVVHTVQLPLIAPFRSALGTIQDRPQILIELKGAGISGWGESAVLPFPYYNGETPQTALHILKDYAIPAFLKMKPQSPQELQEILGNIVGHRIAKAGLEMAYWDWIAKKEQIPLYKKLGGKRDRIAVGVSVPLFEKPTSLLSAVEKFLAQGYQKIKIKIEPGQDIDLVAALFQEFPNIPLMVDANSAYTLKDAHVFQLLDEYPLMMIEQPLRAGDLLEHSRLQKLIKNSICLDESVEDFHDAKDAIELGSCKIVNIKTSRVGGHVESKRIHDICQQHGLGVWCGGMLETGIGRAHNMAIATLENFIYPGDISESRRYYHEDIVLPEITLENDGTLKLSEKSGIGFEVNELALSKYAVSCEEFRTSST